MIDNAFAINKKITIKNRLLKSAMSEQLADDEHNPSPEMIKLYEVWASGGVGMCVTGNVMVDRSQLGEPKNVVLDEQSDMSKFTELAKQGALNKTQLLMQLNHPGKQIPNILSPEPVAPSSIPLGTGLEVAFNTPRALRHEEVLEIINAFATAANLAEQAGFSGVQVHAAHGYLVNQFLSPSHNQRNDLWGGSLENRQRFLLDICRAVREKTGDNFILSVKLNSADFMEGGFSEEDSMRVIEALENVGIDHLEISGGTYESPSMIGDDVGGKPKVVKESTKKREAFFLEYAEKARERTSLPLAVTGGFRTVKAMNAALDSGAIDFIGLARPMALDPQLPNKAMQDANFKADFQRPATRFAYINRMTGIDLIWFEAQLLRIGQGKQPSASLSPWLVILKMLAVSGRVMFKKRRA